MPRPLKGGAGKLTKVVTIQEQVENATSGASNPYYRDVATVRASISPLSGRELFQAQQVQSATDVLIRVRSIPWLEPKHRICHQDSVRKRERFFNIGRIQDDPDSSRVYQDVYCTEWTEAPAGAGVASA